MGGRGSLGGTDGRGLERQLSSVEDACTTTPENRCLLGFRWGLAFSLPPGFARRLVAASLLCRAGFSPPFSRDPQLRERREPLALTYVRIDCQFQNPHIGQVDLVILNLGRRSRGIEVPLLPYDFLCRPVLLWPPTE